MMTLYGEPAWELNQFARKNRALWNAWIYQGIAPDERAAIAKKIGIDLEDTEWDAAKGAEVKTLFAAPRHGKTSAARRRAFFLSP